MIGFLIGNLSTIIIAMVLVGIVTLIICKMRKDKKAGKTCGCNCGCSGCSSAGNCHK